MSTPAPTTLLQTCFASALDDVGEPRQRVQLLSMGRQATRNGNPPAVEVSDLAHAEAIVAATRDYLGATQAMFDYDHQSVFGARPGVGGRAEAAGWITGYHADETGVWASVDWTDEAAAALRAKKYRYVSPVFDVEKATGRVVRIRNAALTNTPNLDLAEVASALATSAHSASQEDGTSMSTAKIAEALGLSATSDEGAIIGAIEKLKSNRTAVASALGVAGDADEATMLAAASAARDPDPTQFVPKAMFDELNGRVQEIHAKGIEAKVASAIEDGKLMPSQKGWATRLGTKDEKELDTFLASAVPVVDQGADGKTAGKPGEPTDKLTEEERHTASALGITDDEYLAAKGEQQKDA